MNEYGGLDSKTQILKSTVETHSCPPRENCPTCGGRNICTTCSGRGKETCRVCNGNGEVDCGACEGNGRCHKCDGEGGFYCHTCWGTGHLYNGEECVYCKGTGTITCDECHGKRYCQKCSGHGKLRCYQCDGARVQTCSTCRGSGQCNVCDSNGKVTCRRCEGTGSYQTYLAFRATSYSKSWIGHELKQEEVDEGLSGYQTYQGAYREWSDAYTKQYDKEKEIQNECFDKLNEDERKEFMRRVDELRLQRQNRNTLGANSSADKPWLSEMNVMRIPVTTVYYPVDGRP